MMIENERNEITLIYHSDKNEDRKMLAFVETISTYKIKSLDLKRTLLTETQMAEIAVKMNKPISDLLDDTYMNAIANGKGIQYLKAMSCADILKLIIQNPSFLVTPILIIGQKAYPYASAFAMLKESFSINGVAAIASANTEEKR